MSEQYTEGVKSDWQPMDDGTYMVNLGTPIRINLNGEVHHLEPGRWRLVYEDGVCKSVAPFRQ